MELNTTLVQLRAPSTFERGISARKNAIKYIVHTYFVLWRIRSSSSFSSNPFRGFQFHWASSSVPPSKSLSLSGSVMWLICFAVLPKNKIPGGWNQSCNVMHTKIRITMVYIISTIQRNLKQWFKRVQIKYAWNQIMPWNGWPFAENCAGSKN